MKTAVNNTYLRLNLCINDKGNNTLFTEKKINEKKNYIFFIFLFLMKITLYTIDTVFCFRHCCHLCVYFVTCYDITSFKHSNCYILLLSSFYFMLSGNYY